MKQIVMIMSLIMMNFSPAANVDKKVEFDCPIFMGTVESVEVNKDTGKPERVLVDGYIRTTTVYKTQVMAIISDDTKLVFNKDVKNKDGAIQRGDTVYVVFSPAMTFSIPPQSVAKKMEVYSKEKYKKMKNEEKKIFEFKKKEVINSDKI